MHAPDIKLVIRYWLVVLAWMIMIFLASTDVGSGEHTSRIVQPLLRLWFPKMPYSQIEAIHLGIRKLAHLFEYAVLAILVWRAIVKPSHWKLKVWYWRWVGFALIICSSYAIFDEYHQSFIMSRSPSVWDVGIDSIGALAGLIMLWVLRMQHKNRLLAAAEQNSAALKTSNTHSL
jgi:VanZ family protein